MQTPHFRSKSLKLKTLFSLTLAFFVQHADASNYNLKIEFDAPTFVLPQFTGPFREREASIAPEEYETAERWQSMLDAGQREEVIKELEEFYDIELSPAMLALKAQIYFSLELHEKAEKTYKAVLSRKPQLIRAHADIGQLYLIKEDFAKAREHFAKAVSYGSNEAIIHGQLAYLNLKMYGAFTAISEYQQAMALEPENPQWQAGLLAALSQAKMYDAAMALVREMVERHPEESGLWLNQATLALEMDDPALALSSLEMAMLLGDKSKNNIRAAVQLHLQLNSYDRAIELLEADLDSSKLDIKTLNEYLAWLGQVHMWDKSAKLLSIAEQKLGEMSQDDQSIFYLNRARVSIAQKKSDLADKYFNQSLEKNPTNGESLISYAKFCADKKDHVKAELLYIRAEGIDSSEKQALLGRAQLYIAMQDYRSALLHLKTAYAKYPDQLQLRDNIEIIENIIRTTDI